MATSPFLPTQIPNCILWFDAADSSTLLTSGSQVTRWANKGTLNVFGSNVAVSPYTAGANPPGTVSTSNTFSGGTSNVLSFPPSSGFNGSYLGVSNVVTTQKSRVRVYIFSISNPGADNYFRVITSSDKVTLGKQVGFAAWNRDGNGIINWPTGYDATEQLTLGGQGDFAGTLTNSVPFIIVFRHSTTLANNYVSVNGTQITAPAANQALVNGYFTGTDNFALGVGTGYSATLLLGEVMQYDGEITTPQIRQLEGYLAWKWGRTAQLPGTHPYKNYAPTGTTLLIPTQLNFINTFGTVGNLTLPSTFALAGRTLTFKDQVGALSTNSLILTTNNANQTIDSAITSTINTTALGWQTLVAGNNNKWYTVGGTLINTINTSTIQSLGVSTNFISSGNLFTSTLALRDQTVPASTNTLSVQSTFLIYNTGLQSTIISGTRQSFGGLFLRAAAQFVPSQLANLVIWLDPADVSTISISGSTIVSIQDKSPTQALFNQGTIKPTNTVPINGLTTMAFAGGSGSTNVLGTLTTTPYNNITQFSLFVVNRPTWASGTLSQSPCMVGIRSAVTTTISWHNYSTYTTGYIGWNGSATTNAPLAITQDELILFEIVQGASSFIPYKNGNASSSVAYTITARTGLPASVGNSYVGQTEGFQGQIAEVVFFSRTLSTIERQQVEGYLAWKWGLVKELPASHPFKNAPP